ncbi:MAG: hypothetical protein E7K47_21805, partial [Acidovorax sp.]|nr:hypothetical protein [Acidovorax sp.]
VGTDTVEITSTGNTVMTNVSGVETVLLSSANTGTLTLSSGVTSITESNGGAQTITLGAAVSGLTANLGAGNDSITLANGTNSITTTNVETVTGGTGADTITTTTAATLVGGAGADILNGMTGGNDVYVFTTLGGISTLSGMDTISVLETSDVIQLVDQGTETGIGGGTVRVTAAATNVSLASTLIEAANLASTADGSTNSAVAWFQYGGNTYLVQDGSVSTSFVNGTDQIIKITGLVDLTTTGVIAFA